MKKVLIVTGITIIGLLSACSNDNSQNNLSNPDSTQNTDNNPQKAGEEFLAKKKAEADVKTLPSGLMYKIIKSGTGKTPKLTDSVTTHYRGTLTNGKEFDSSYSRSEPTTFPVNGVIKGWTEALQLMKEGDTWELYIPSALAYGEAGYASVIPPNSTLVFELNLIKVN